MKVLVTGSEGYIGKHLVQMLNQNKIYDETTKIALEKSVKSYLALHMRIINKTGVITYNEAEALICAQVKTLCTKGRVEKAVITNSILGFLNDQKTQPVKYLDGPTQDKLKNEFNEKVALANKTCADTKKKYDEIKEAYSCAPKLPEMVAYKTASGQMSIKAKDPAAKTEIMPERTCHFQQDEAKRKHQELQGIAKQSMEINMQLMVGSELGPLFATHAFRKAVRTLTPDFVFQNCMKVKGTVLNPVYHKSINEARVELYGLAARELKNIQAKRILPPTHVDKELELERYLKTNPLTISDLLKRSNDPNYAKSVCYYIKDIYHTDRINNYIDIGLMSVGVISGLAFGFATGGVGFAFVGPAALTLGALSLGSSVALYKKNQMETSQLVRDNQSIQQAMATKQRELDKGLANIVTNQEKIGDLEDMQTWNGVGVIAEVVGFAIPATKIALSLKTLEKAAPMVYKLVKGTNNIEKAVTMNKASGMAQKAINALKLPKGAPLDLLSSNQKVILVALISNLDNAQAAALTEKLSKLNPAQLTKFFSMVDDVKTLNLGENALKVAIAEFTATGKVKRLVSPMSADEIAKFGPSVPKDATKVAAAFPESTTAIKQAFPGITPTQLQTILSDVKKQYFGRVGDAEIALIFERFKAQGAVSYADYVKRFTQLTALKSKHPEFFVKDGPMNSPAFKDESDLIKLAYLDELEKNGVPLRNAKNELIMAADGVTPLRKKIAGLTPLQRIEAMTKEINAIAVQKPCAI